jgi:peptidoglycan L-alanyl-D-glutamate endopeptidase CwlK
MYHLSNRSKKNSEGVDQRLIEIRDLAIHITVVDFGIPGSGGLRTAEEQRALFVAMKSKCDGYDKLSRHQSGKALDFYAYVDGHASWEEKHLAMVAAAFLQAAAMLGYKLKWGGLWKGFKDMPHVQLA